MYQAPILNARKSSKLTGPFDVFDVPNIRETIQKRYKNDNERRKQDALISYDFVETLNLNDYFAKKTNWLNKNKFINTYSLYKAMNTYLPNYKMLSNMKLPIKMQNKLKEEPKINANKNASNQAFLYESESNIISSSVNKLK